MRETERECRVDPVVIHKIINGKSTENARKKVLDEFGMTGSESFMHMCCKGGEGA